MPVAFWIKKHEEKKEAESNYCSSAKEWSTVDLDIKFRTASEMSRPGPRPRPDLPARARRPHNQHVGPADMKTSQEIASFFGLLMARRLQLAIPSDSIPLSTSRLVKVWRDFAHLLDLPCLPPPLFLPSSIPPRVIAFATLDPVGGLSGAVTPLARITNGRPFTLVALLLLIAPESC